MPLELCALSAQGEEGRGPVLPPPAPRLGGWRVNSVHFLWSLWMSWVVMIYT